MFDKKSKTRIAVFCLLVIACVALWTLLDRIAAYKQASQLGEVALALLGIGISAGGLMWAGICLAALWCPQKKREINEKDVARLVAALQEIQGIPRMPDYGGFGCGYNGALYTVGKIAGDALAAVGVEGSVGE